MRRRGGVIWSSIVRPGERHGAVAVNPLRDDLASGHVHRGEDRDGAVPDVLDLPPGVPAGPAGDLGVLTGLAWMPVASSTLISTVRRGGSRYRRHTCPAGSQNEGPRCGSSQPRALCGRRPPRPAPGPRPMPRSAGPAPGGGRGSASGTTATRRRAGRRSDGDGRQPRAGPVHFRRPQRGLSEKPGRPRTANRPRQVRTTAAPQPRPRAMAASPSRPRRQHHLRP